MRTAAAVLALTLAAGEAAAGSITGGLSHRMTIAGDYWVHGSETSPTEVWLVGVDAKPRASHGISGYGAYAVLPFLEVGARVTYIPMLGNAIYRDDAVAGFNRNGTVGSTVSTRALVQGIVSVVPAVDAVLFGEAGGSFLFPQGDLYIGLGTLPDTKRNVHRLGPSFALGTGLIYTLPSGTGIRADLMLERESWQLYDVWTTVAVPGSGAAKYQWEAEAHTSRVTLQLGFRFGGPRPVAKAPAAAPPAPQATPAPPPATPKPTPAPASTPIPAPMPAPPPRGGA